MLLALLIVICYVPVQKMGQKQGEITQWPSSRLSSDATRRASSEERETKLISESCLGSCSDHGCKQLSDTADAEILTLPSYCKCS